MSQPCDRKGAPPALEVRQLTVHYREAPVLWNVELTLPRGVMAAVVGPNGAGKSTLLKALVGAVRPTSGTALFFGESFDEARSRVAYVPQRALVDWTFPITAFELVLMGRYGKLGLLARPSRADKEAAYAALDKVGMTSFAERQIGELSGGQQQRLFLARALLQEADLYLMDEPFAAVDAATEKSIVTLLKELKEQRKTLLLVHHDLTTVRDYFDWVILLSTCLVSAGPTEEVLKPELLSKIYGQELTLLGEVGRLSQQKTTGGKS